MLQQAPKLLFSRIALQHAAAASCTCLQQQQGSLLHAPQQQQQQWSTHQARWQSSSSKAAADAVQHSSSSSGWSWFGSSTAQQQPAPAATAAAAAGGITDPAAATATAAAAAADPTVLVEAAAAATAPAADAVELISQADALVDASSAAADAMLAAAQAGCWINTRLFIDVLMWSHSGGFPWFEAIMVSNVVIKLAALPLTIFSQKWAPMMSQMTADTKELKNIAAKMAKASTASQYAECAQEFQAAQMEFNMKYHGKRRYAYITPVGMILQMLVFISQFNAISTLANAKLPSMTYEGALWFTDLTIPDPIMVLPLLCAGMTAVQANSKRFRDVMMTQNAQAAGPMRVLMTAMGGVILFAGYFTPSAMALLWATNSAFSIAQSGLLGSPVARRALGLPAMPSPPPASSSSSSGGGGAAGFLAELTGQAAPEQQPKPLPAAAVGAPPPGTPIAVNYMSSKPSRRRGKVF